MAEQKAPPSKPSGGSTFNDVLDVLSVAFSRLKEVATTYRFSFVFVLYAIAMALYGLFSGNMDPAIQKIAFVSSAISAAAIFVLIYALYKLIELRSEEEKRLGLVFTWRAERAKKNVRWAKIEEYMASPHPSDWKIAILEADNILDDIVKRMGYKGETLGERMKTIEASDFPHLDEAWEVHKIRNQIAHKGTDYPLARTEAENAIDSYHRIFKALNYL